MLALAVITLLATQDAQDAAPPPAVPAPTTPAAPAPATPAPTTPAPTTTATPAAPAPATATPAASAPRLTAEQEEPLAVALEAAALNAKSNRMVQGWGSIGLGLGVVTYEVVTLGVVAGSEHGSTIDQALGYDVVLGTVFGLALAGGGTAALIRETPAESRLDEWRAMDHATPEQRFRRSADVLKGVKKNAQDFEDSRWLTPAVGVPAGLIGVGAGAILVAADGATSAQDKAGAGITSNELENMALLSFMAGGFSLAASTATIFWDQSTDDALLKALHEDRALRPVLDAP